MDAAETNISQRPCTESQITVTEHLMDDKDSTTY
jgi:hypothetical protein